jgi:hypothetical protein
MSWVVVAMVSAPAATAPVAGVVGTVSARACGPSSVPTTRKRPTRGSGAPLAAVCAARAAQAVARLEASSVAAAIKLVCAAENSDCPSTITGLLTSKV